MTGGCGGHAGLPADLRVAAVAMLDRLEPALRRLRETGAPEPEPGPCAVCPVCALISLVRGERPEMAVRWADQAVGLLTLLRSALADGPPDPPPPAPPPPPARRVERIPVVRP